MYKFYTILFQFSSITQLFTLMSVISFTDFNNYLNQLKKNKADVQNSFMTIFFVLDDHTK